MNLSLALSAGVMHRNSMISCYGYLRMSLRTEWSWRGAYPDWVGHRTPCGGVFSMAFMMLGSLRMQANDDDLGGFPGRFQAVREGLDHGVPPARSLTTILLRPPIRTVWRAICAILLRARPSAAIPGGPLGGPAGRQAHPPRPSRRLDVVSAIQLPSPSFGPCGPARPAPRRPRDGQW